MDNDRRSGRPVGKRSHTTHGQLPRYDQALRQAKNQGQKIKLSLACEYGGNDAFEVIGAVEEVDKYDVAIKFPGTERVVWFKKAFVVATEVLR